jgi:hypothetical protein
MRPGIWRQHTLRKNGAQSFRVIKSKVERVRGTTVFTLDTNVAKNAFRRTEQPQRLINSMRREIKKHAAARLRVLFPGVCPYLRSATVKR